MGVLLRAQSRLIERLKKRVDDAGVIRLVRAYSNAGVILLATTFWQGCPFAPAMPGQIGELRDLHRDAHKRRQ